MTIDEKGLSDKQKVMSRSLFNPKRMISRKIIDAIKKEGSIREVCKERGVNRSTIQRISRMENYNIDTLLGVLYEFGLQIKIVERDGEK